MAGISFLFVTIEGNDVEILFYFFIWHWMDSISIDERILIKGTGMATMVVTSHEHGWSVHLFDVFLSCSVIWSLFTSMCFLHANKHQLPVQWFKILPLNAHLKKDEMVVQYILRCIFWGIQCNIELCWEWRGICQGVDMFCSGVHLYLNRDKSLIYCNTSFVN